MTTLSRWQFSRAGITNVYQYENEVLDFRDGRLLLRGINGSGKSTAMNMLLPFLLTGKTRGIDAAGEQTGVLKSWMLSGRDEKQPVGYLWLEFARRAGPDADVEYLVIGCGIKANRATDTVATWWFITARRPGIDFELLEQQIPLSADSLRHVIQPDLVYPQDRRADYRHELSQRLYGGASIDSFLDLINTVRSPRVGDRVDLELPQYLVAALPNLSETALIEAARPLDDLDEHRRNVGDLGATAATLAAIADTYRSYAVAELHRELNAARAALTDLRRKRRAVSQAQQAWIDAREAETQARESLAELEVQFEQDSQQVQALERSPAYTEGRQLEDLRRHVQSLQRQLEQDAANLAIHAERQPRADADVVQAEQRTDQLCAELREQLAALGHSAEHAALGERPPALPAVPRLSIDEQADAAITEPLEPYDAAAADSALTQLAAAAQARKLDIDAARELLRRVEIAGAALARARSAEADAIEAQQHSAERFDDSRGQLQAARNSWLQATDDWRQRAREALANAGAAAGFERIEAPYLSAATADSAELATVRQQLDTGINTTRDARQRVAIALQARRDDCIETLAAAQLELDELNALREPPVPSPDWQQRAELCLADLVDFRDDLSAPECAALEAALQASGLLSATIGADGLTLQSGELIIAAAQPVARPLGELLTIALPPQCDIEPGQVRAALDGIGTDWSSDARSVITTDGRFRLGALAGRHAKPNAEYVGASARRARLARLREDAARSVERARQAQQRAEAELQRATSFVDALDALRRELPTLDRVDRAMATARALEDELARARERVAQRRDQLASAENSLSAIEQECDRQCRNWRLPNDHRALDALQRSLDELTGGTAAARRAGADIARACRDWTAAADRWRIARQDWRQARERAQASQSDYDAKRAQLDTLEATLGSSYAEVVRQIEHYQRRVSESRQSMPAARAGAEQCIRLTQAAAGEKDNCLAAERASEQRCSDQYQQLQAVTAVPGLLDAAAPDGAQLPAGSADATGLDALARALADRLPADDGSDTDADNVRRSLRQRRNALGAGWDAEDQQPDPQLPIAVWVNGPLGQMPLPESLQTVDTQLARLQALLTEKQDQALRNLLQGLIAREVAEKMFMAQRLIERMNERLGSVTSSHGIGVRLRWRRSPELDDSVASSVKILAKQPDLRSAAEEDSLREALASALDEARRLEPEAPYRQLIAQVFDYRAWHDMAVLLRRGDDPERRLTRRTPLSEGEKKLVSYLPLFAAVAASCDALADTGDASSPRFLLLDDAFAKVSEDNHAALFGLLVDLDLDFIATSERLWGTHASVPGLAITEVVRDTALGAILLEHSLWDGKTLRMAAPIDLERQVFGEHLPARDESKEPYHGD